MSALSKLKGSCGDAAVPGDVVNDNVPAAQHQHDNWGYEVTAKPRFDAAARSTLRAFAWLMIELDAGDFNEPPGTHRPLDFER
jgi:hypothetical protein